MLGNRIKYGATTTIYFYLKNITSYGAPATSRTPYCYISKDGGTAATTSASVAEVNSSSLPGVYSVALSTSETSAYIILANLYDSSYTTYTSEPVLLYTDGTLLAGSSDSFGTVNANISTISGDTPAANNLEKFFDVTGYGIQPASAATEVAADLSKINGSTDGVSSLSKGSNSILQGSVTTGSTTSSIKGTGALSATDDFYNDRMLLFTSGDLQYQGKPITDYVGSSKTFTTDPFTSAPASSDTFIIV